MQVLPCFLCGRNLEKRTTKRRKPYFVCDGCGIQLFVRGKQGIEKLDQFFRNAAQAEIPYQQHAQHFHEMQAILKEIDDVQQAINKLGISYFFSEEKLRIRNALLKRKDNLFVQLEEFAEGKENAAN
jgi:DNA-directed RNA polymerase subunit RPC12/RpoP